MVNFRVTLFQRPATINRLADTSGITTVIGAFNASNMASRAARPRLQMALQGPAWRAAPRSSASSRFASTQSSKPIVLEKPLKFNPPSHGSRLRKNTMPKHYGGVTTADEIAAQRMRSYPGMMAPEGTWSHWFWHSKTLHVFITMVCVYSSSFPSPLPSISLY